jgi:hypothetical protein
MKFETNKSMVVFNGTLNSIAVIEVGEYKIKKIKPLNTEDKQLIWYQIKNTLHIFALNPKNIPKGLIIKGFFYRFTILLRSKQKISY